MFNPQNLKCQFKIMFRKHSRRKPIRQPHIRYAVLRKFVHHATYTLIVEELTNKDIAYKYGFTPIEVEYHWFCRKINRTDQTVRDEIRKIWVEGIANEPLADARYCLHLLHGIVVDPKTAPQNAILAIKEARNIVGHTDADKEAMKESGKTDISLTIQDEMKEFFNKETDDNG